MGAIPASARPSIGRQGSEGPPPPAPGWFEQVAASSRVNQDASDEAVKGRILEGYNELFDALVDKGIPAESLERKTEWYEADPRWFGAAALDDDRIWAAARRAGLKDLPDSREDYERWLVNRRGEAADDFALLARGEGAGATVAQTGGGIVAGMGESNLGPLQFTFGLGGRTIAQAALRNGVVGLADEALNVPGRARNMEKLGREYGAGDMALDLGGAFAGGAGLTVAGEFAGRYVIPKAVSAARGGFERAVAANWERLPKGLQARWAGELPTVGTPEHDILLADTSEALIGTENLAEHEAGSLAVVRREAEIDARSPLAPSGAATALHPQLLAEAMGRILAAVPDAPVPAATGARRSRASLARGTAVRPPAAASGGGSLDNRIVSGLVARGLSQEHARGIAAGIHAESGSRPDALNPSSGAAHLGQWLGPRKKELRRRYGANPSLDQQLDFLVWELRGGDHGGAKVLAQASEVDVLRSYIVDFMRPAKGAETTGDLHRGMAALGRSGEAIPVGRADGARVRDEVSERDALQAEIDEIETRMGALRAERAGGDEMTVESYVEQYIAGRWREEAPSPEVEQFAANNADAIEAAFGARLSADPPRRSTIERQDSAADPFDPDKPSPQVEALLPQLRAIEGDRSRSINAIGAIANELGASPVDVRRGLTLLAGQGRLAMNRRTGKFLRKPERADPYELLEFIAKSGGLRDDEGHSLGLRGLSKRERAEMSPEAQRRLIAKRAKGSRDLQRMTRSHGKLLRHEGRSVDQLGELLWEAQFFVERPTVAEVLDLVEQRIMSGKPMYPPGHLPSEPARAGSNGPEVGDEEWNWRRTEIEDVLYERMGFDEGSVPLDMVDDLVRFYLDSDHSDAETAMFDGVNLLLAKIEAEAIARNPEGGYEPIDYEPPAFARERPDAADIPSEEDLAGWEAAGFAAAEGGEGGGRGGAAFGDEGGPRLADLPAADRSPFLDPDSEPAKAQADSLAHDALAQYQAIYDSPRTADEAAELLGPTKDDSERAEWELGWASGRNGGPEPEPDNPFHDGYVVGRNTFDRQGPLAELGEGDQLDFAAPSAEQRRIALERQTEGRLKGDAAQKPPGSDGGLFDVRAENLGFRLDEEGEPINLADLLDELDLEEAELKQIRDCM